MESLELLDKLEVKLIVADFAVSFEEDFEEVI
jgi:hypothetical protein